MLQQRSHLYLKAERHVWYTADIVQRLVAEAVQCMQPPFVDGILPIHIKKTLHHGGHHVDIVEIKGDDAQAQDVGDICQTLVFGALDFQFARQ